VDTYCVSYLFFFFFLPLNETVFNQLTASNNQYLVPLPGLFLDIICRALDAVVMKIHKEYQTPGISTQDTIQQVRTLNLLLVPCTD
jgi:hypothetical protein